MLHHSVYYRRVPPFRPGKGHKFSHVLFDSRLPVHSRREIEKFSSVAIGISSDSDLHGTQGRHDRAAKAFDFFVVLLSMFKSGRSEYYLHKCLTRVFFV